jgi:enoyl-CoA hydratase/carnithine racemase
MDPVLFEKDGAVGLLTLNRPEKRNALSLEVMAAITELLDRIAADQSVRVLVLRGNGPAFCAGHDLNELTGDYDIQHFRNIFNVCSIMMQKIHQLPQPVIAQVHGIATAAGCQLVAACDLAVAEEGAQFATPGVKIGLFCTTPALPLVRVIGRRRALEMLFSGRFVTAREAEHFGLVNRVVPPERLSDEARDWAQQMAQFSPFTLARKPFMPRWIWMKPPPTATGRKPWQATAWRRTPARASAHFWKNGSRSGRGAEPAAPY